MRVWHVVLPLGLLLTFACSKKSDPQRTDKSAPACNSFEGGKLSAKWTDCPDHIQREVRCATFVEDLKCDCFEDGVFKTFFTAKDPPLSTRADATRIANKSCRWSLE